MTMPRPEHYERAPDGAVWPGTLAGLLQAFNDTAAESLRIPDQEFTIQAIRDGQSHPFRVYRNGHEVKT
jgi:hypothetical protein